MLRKLSVSCMDKIIVLKLGGWCLGYISGGGGGSYAASVV